MESVRKLIFLMLLMLLPVITEAAVVKGRVFDGGDKSAVDGVLVRLYRVSAADTAFVDGATSDSIGKFEFKNVRNGNYSLRFVCLGYNDHEVATTVKGREVVIDSVKLTTNALVLEETVVIGQKPDVVMKEDTVEYNADAFVKGANAMVIDLLKNIPGIEVEEDGTIKAHGKTVKSLLVNDREFFLNDNKTAMENLPADIVDKLQVVDRKSELSRLTGVDDGEEETVINLTVKKEKNRGWFGHGSAAYGTDDRYRGNLFLNHFIDKDQYSVTAGADNTGGPIAKNRHVGFNVNVGDKNKLMLESSVSYRYNMRENYSRVNREYVYADSTSYYQGENSSRNDGHNVNGSARVMWKPDTLNTINFRPRFSFSRSTNGSSDVTASQAGDAEHSLVNTSERQRMGEGNNYSVAANLVYSRRFKARKGRNFSIELNFDYSNNESDNQNYAKNRFFMVDGKDEDIAQYIDNISKNNSMRARVSWSEPIGDVKKAMSVNAYYNVNMRLRNSDKYVYDFDPNDEGYIDPELLEKFEEYGIVNTDQSSVFRNTILNQNGQVSFRKEHEKYSINTGVTFNSMMNRSKDHINENRSLGERWTFNYAPFVRFRWKIAKRHNFTINYRNRTSEPSINYLQPVADKSNTLNVVIGNPDLKDTFTHTVNMEYRKNDTETQRNLMVSMSGDVTSNSIVNKTISDPTTGGKVTTYENLSGVWNASMRTDLSLPIVQKLLFFDNGLNLGVNRRLSYIDGELNSNMSWSFRFNPSLRIRPGNFNISLRPYYNLSAARNSISTRNNKDVHRYGCSLNLHYESPIGIKASTNVRYGNSKGMSKNFNEEQCLWNASLEYAMLKGKNLIFQLQVTDILQQQKGVSKNVNASYEEERWTTVMPRYCMLTITYRLQKFGGKMGKKKSK